MIGRQAFPSPGNGFLQVQPNDVSILELSTNFRYNAKQIYSNTNEQLRHAQRFTASYVTGSHALKGGVQFEEGVSNQETRVHSDMTYTFLRSAPNTLTQYGTPFLQKDRAFELGLFVQDRWTHKRLTLNYGVRYDYFNGYVPAQQLPAVQFLAAREFEPVHDVPAWKDVNPRIGASYDLFGNGRTAVKASLGRYVENAGTVIGAITGANNPIATSVTSVNRTWNDTDGDYVPDCNLANPGANGECGAFDNMNFGQNNPRATQYADDVLRGFGVRNWAWDFSTEVQQQLHSGVSVTAGYYRNWAGNFRVTDNLEVMPADHSPYCIIAPVDPRLPGGGGYQVCGLYDVAPAKFGQVQNLVTQSSHYYGAEAEVTCESGPSTSVRRGTCGTSDFFNVTVNARIGSGIQLGGGLDTGRTTFDSCFVVDSPQQLLNCHTEVPFKAQTQVKVFGSYPLPGDFVVSGTLQNVSGAAVDAFYSATNAEIAPSLGRNLAACGTRVPCTATARVQLIAPQTHFLDRRTQLDVRLTKVFNLISNVRLQVNVDVYNALNSSSILGVESTYGPRWLQPVAGGVSGGTGEGDAILPGRLIQFGGRLTF
jgi:hypothetical protein